MFPRQYEKFVWPTGSSGQDWTLDSPSSWLQFGLISGGQDLGMNTGITNVFEFRDGKKNCTDATTVFGGAGERLENDTLSYGALNNFWNCAFFPNLTESFRDGSLPAENRTFLADRVDVNSSTSAEVSSFLSTCLVAYCDNADRCRTSSCTMLRLTVGDKLLSASAVNDCLDNICSSPPQYSSNPDIAGIGAISSYVVQFGISILITIIVLMSLGVGALMRGEKRPGSCPKAEARLIDRFTRVQSIIETLLLTLDEFQRAQCCFAIAIDIAAFITLQNKDSMTERDKDAITMASGVGIGPTTLVLAVLMAFNERNSALTFWLSVFTWIFSLAVGIHAEILKNALSIWAIDSSYPAACGGISPAELCRAQREEDSNISITMTVVTFILAVPFLTIWHLWPAAIRQTPIYNPRKIRQDANRMSGKASTIITSTNDSVQTIKLNTDKFPLHAVVFVCIASIFSIAAFFDHLMFLLRQGEVNMEWSFGQIVAITVWLPSMLSFVNDWFYGPIRGRVQQFPDSLKIVRVPVVRVEYVETKFEDAKSEEEEKEPVWSVKSVSSGDEASTIG